MLNFKTKIKLECKLKLKQSSFFFKVYSVFEIIWEGICMDRFDCTVSMPIKFENRNIICAEGYPISILSESVYCDGVLSSSAP